MPKYISKEKTGLLGGKYTETTVKPTDYERGKAWGEKAAGTLFQRVHENRAMRESHETGDVETYAAVLEERLGHSFKRWFMLGGILGIILWIAYGFWAFLLIAGIVTGRVILGRKRRDEKLLQFAEEHKNPIVRLSEDMAHANPRTYIMILSTGLEFGIENTDERMPLLVETAYKAVQNQIPEGVLATQLAGRLNMALDLAERMAAKLMEVLHGEHDQLVTDQNIIDYLGPEFLPKNVEVQAEMARTPQEQVPNRSSSRTTNEQMTKCHICGKQVGAGEFSAHMRSHIR